MNRATSRWCFSGVAKTANVESHRRFPGAFQDNSIEITVGLKNPCKLFFPSAENKIFPQPFVTTTFRAQANRRHVNVDFLFQVFKNVTPRLFVRNTSSLASSALMAERSYQAGASCKEKETKTQIHKQMKLTSLTLTLSLLTLAAVPALADTHAFSGNTTGLPTFNRTTEPGDALSSFGTEVSYYSLPFTVGLSGNYNLTLNATDPVSYDTFLHLYSGSFNPASPLDNFFAANDDAPGGNLFGSALSGVSLVAGNSYYFVADGFGNSDNGAFNATISGPGIVSVPEPSALDIAGVAGLMLFRKRQARR